MLLLTPEFGFCAHCNVVFHLMTMGRVSVYLGVFTKGSKSALSVKCEFTILIPGFWLSDHLLLSVSMERMVGWLDGVGAGTLRGENFSVNDC